MEQQENNLPSSFTHCFLPHFWVSSYCSKICWVFFSPLIDLKHRLCSLSSLSSVILRKLDGDFLFLVDQVSAFFSLKPWRSCPITSTHRMNVYRSTSRLSWNVSLSSHVPLCSEQSVHPSLLECLSVPFTP